MHYGSGRTTSIFGSAVRTFPWKQARVFTIVSSLVDTLSENPAAKLTAQQILERVQRRQGASEI